VKLRTTQLYCFLVLSINMHHSAAVHIDNNQSNINSLTTANWIALFYYMHVLCRIPLSATMSSLLLTSGYGLTVSFI